MKRNKQGRFTGAEIITNKVIAEIDERLHETEDSLSDIAGDISAKTGGKYLYCYRIVRERYAIMKKKDLHIE